MKIILFNIFTLNQHIYWIILISIFNTVIFIIVFSYLLFTLINVFNWIYLWF